MKSVAGTLRLDLAQYRELASFAQFGSDLDETTRNRLERGKRIVEVLKQPQFVPLPIEQQVVMIWTVTKGYLDDVAVEDIKDFEERLLDFMKSRKEKLLGKIAKEKTLEDSTQKELEKSLSEFKLGFKTASVKKK